MPAATPEFVAHCTELLACLGPVRARRMFGGHGLYAGDVFVALIAFERLYLKVDAVSRPVFEAAGGAPFVYAANGRTVSLGYFSAPDDAMESPPAMQPWARHALAAALRARASKPVAARRASAASARNGAAHSTAEKRKAEKR